MVVMMTGEEVDHFLALLGIRHIVTITGTRLHMIETPPVPSIITTMATEIPMTMKNMVIMVRSRRIIVSMLHIPTIITLKIMVTMVHSRRIIISMLQFRMIALAMITVGTAPVIMFLMILVYQDRDVMIKIYIYQNPLKQCSIESPNKTFIYNKNS